MFSVCDEGVKTILTYGYKDKYLECSLLLYWLTKVVVADSPPRSMTSLALGHWLDFQYEA